MKLLKAYKLNGATKEPLNILDIGKNIGNSFIYGRINTAVALDFKAETIRVSFDYFQVFNGVSEVIEQGEIEVHRNVLMFGRDLLDGMTFINGGTHPFDDMEIMLMNVFKSKMSGDFIGGINTSYPCDGIDIIDESELI